MRMLDLLTNQPRLLGTTSWHTVPQDQISSFADATGDRQWIHTDPERAARGPFGQQIAHGFLVLALAPILVQEVVTVEDSHMGINYGTDRVRFLSPVVVDSRIRGRVELIHGSQHGEDSILTKFLLTVEADGLNKPAMVAELLMLHYGRLEL